MKLKYGGYRLDTFNGWGGIGIYDEEQVIGIVENEQEKIDIIPVDAIIAGNGAGWDSDTILDEKICKQLVELFNSAQNK